MIIRNIEFGSTEYAQEMDLRDRILRRPLGLSFSKEELAREGNDLHFGAFSGGKLLGCLVLSPLTDVVIKMRQVAVDSNSQRAGIGKRLVKYSEEISRANGYSMIQLNARDAAVPFYLGLGYEVHGDVFEEVGIPHRKMRKHLVGGSKIPSDP